jgi:hypothetical protein
MKYGVCFIIKVFPAALAIEFLVRTVTSIFLYILRIAGLYLVHLIFLKLEHHRSRTQGNKVEHDGINK